MGARLPQLGTSCREFCVQGFAGCDVCDSGSPRPLLGRRKRNFSETGLVHPCFHHTLRTQKNGYRKEKSGRPFRRCSTSLLIEEMEIEMRFLSPFKLINFLK